MTSDEIMDLAPVIPVLVVEEPDYAVPLAEALVVGGIRALEVTLRTPAALQVIRQMATVSGAVVGVGTVTQPEHYLEAKSAGARFAVTPGATPGLLATARNCGIPTLPGVMTPSEIIAAQEYGFNRLKLFPAGAVGGIAMLKSLASPFAEVRFCPTGGIDSHNLRDYLALPNVGCVGGSWIAPPALIKAQAWERISELSREAVAKAAA